MLLPAFLAAFGYYAVMTVAVGFGIMHLDRPIIMSVVVGLLLGDLRMGIILGATFEAVFLGVVYIGGAAPADPAIGSAFGTAIAILTRAEPEAALSIAVPVAILGYYLSNIPWSTLLPLMVPAMQKAAARGDSRAMARMAYASAFALYLFPAIGIFFGVFFGADAVNRLLEVLPEFIMNGLNAAGAILPAIGFALLINLLFNKKVIAFFFLGFVLSVYLALPSIAIAIIAVVIGVYTFYMLPKRESISAQPVQPEKSTVEEDFFA